MVRPESQMSPDQFYNEEEAAKYTNCSRIIKIQSEMAQRCLELIGVQEIDPQQEEPQFILDIGCGSGLSGEIIEEFGHFWWGIDISESMLRIAQQRETNGEFLLGDIGEGFNCIPGFFDAVISVSAIQWLCNEDRKGHDAWKRSLAFFQSVQRCLKSHGKAAFQFYPENPQQMEMLTNAAIKAGLTGGIYIDFPNSKVAKKYYLVLSTMIQGKLGVIQTLNGKTEEAENEEGSQQRIKRIKNKGKFQVKSKYWIFKKKEAQRMQGREVRPDTKYTGRKRKTLFSQ